MTVLIIFFAVLILVVGFRFGLYIEYSDDGLIVNAKVGPLQLRIIPKKMKRMQSTGREKVKKKRKKKKPGVRSKEKESETTQKKPGDLDKLIELLPPIKKTLDRFRRRFLIKRLVIVFTAAGTDAAATASAYGAANAVIGMLDPLLLNTFRIKHRDFRACADFLAQKPALYIKAVVSLAIWEAVYIALAILPLLLNTMQSKTYRSSENDIKEYNNSKNSYDDNSNSSYSSNDGNDDNSKNW